MKKIIIQVLLIITMLIIYFLQTNIFTNFTIAGVMPNMFIIFMLYIGLYLGRSMGIIHGIICGIFIDIWIGRSMGITSICLALIGLLGGIFDKNFSKDSRITLLFMGAMCTIIYEVILYIINYVVFGTNLEVIIFTRTLGVEVIYNLLLLTILYPLLKFTGYEIENEVKGDKILTRYF
ncbi:MAG: rod shape-determining protein MreD [Clostridia bacterium]|nr:rod shape-determining protein MreD [Clostridia bacterium]